MPSFYIGMIFASDRGCEDTRFQHFFNSCAYFNGVKRKKTMLFIFHAKLKRSVQTYVTIKQRQYFLVKMDESSCQ